MRKSAFTLLELMIVVIIVGILASLAIPQFTKAAEKAKWAGCVQTLGAIRRAMEIYYMEFGDYPPTIYVFNGSNKDCPASLDIGIPDPDADGRYIYVTVPKDFYPICAYGCHDKDKNNIYTSGEPYMLFHYDGRIESFLGAPEF